MTTGNQKFLYDTSSNVLLDHKEGICQKNKLKPQLPCHIEILVG